MLYRSDPLSPTALVPYGSSLLCTPHCSCTVLWCAVLHRALVCGVAPCSSVQCCTVLQCVVLHRALVCGVALYSSFQCCTVSKTWCCTAHQCRVLLSVKRVNVVQSSSGHSVTCSTTRASSTGRRSGGAELVSWHQPEAACCLLFIFLFIQ